MRLVRVVLIAVSVFSVQFCFADNQDMSTSDSQACKAVAKACLSANYTRSSGKKFWQDCMKPIILGQTVQGVTIDPATVKTCRSDKIKQLQDELQEFQKVS